MLGGWRGRAVLLALALTTGALLGPAASGEHESTSVQVDYDRVKAVFGDGPIPDDIEVWAAQRGAVVVHEEPRLDLVVFDVHSRTDASGFVEELPERSAVTFADYGVLLDTATDPDDPRWEDQYAPRLIDAPEAWAIQPGSQDVRVAVVDTGVDGTHPDLQTACGDGCAGDGEGHGTALAGITAAERGNGHGIAGMAHVDLAAYQATATAQAHASEVALALLDAADEGADVVLLGFAGECDFSQTHRCPALAAAIEHAHEQGAVLVAPTGNLGLDHGVQEPATYEAVVAVGSVGLDAERSSFSNAGEHVDVVAPGEDVLTTAPPASLLCGTSPQGLCTISGTSLAAAHVAGLAGLLASHCPALDNGAIAGTIAAHATDLGEAGQDEVYGHGLVDADDALQAAC